MNLNIKAYKNITLVPNEDMKRDKYGGIDYSDSHIYVVTAPAILEVQNREFSHHLDGPTGRKCFKTKHNKKDFWSFNCSYVWYTTWRDALYKISEEFYDLLFFPDKESYFGALASERIYQIFKKYEKQGRQMVDKGETYLLFMKAFDLARQKGLFWLE